MNNPMRNLLDAIEVEKFILYVRRIPEDSDWISDPDWFESREWTYLGSYFSLTEVHNAIEAHFAPYKVMPMAYTILQQTTITAFEDQTLKGWG